MASKPHAQHSLLNPDSWPFGVSSRRLGQPGNATYSGSSAERPDRRYWSAYDHFMAEREARAMRRAYTYWLLAAGFRRLKATVVTLTARAAAWAWGASRIT
jgi:hypothetical protein